MFIEQSHPDSAAQEEKTAVCRVSHVRRMLAEDWSGLMRSWGIGSGHWFWILALIAILSACSNASDREDVKSLIQQAFELHQKGEFAKALPLLHRAYRIEPDDYFVNLLIGIDSLRTGQPKAALSFLRKASRVRPNEEYPLDYLGEAYAQQEIFAEAAQSYIKAVQVAPGSEESAVAFVDFALTRFAAMSEALRSSQKGLAAEYRLRSWALPDGDPSRLSLLRRAADLDPAAPNIWSDLARAALVAGDIDASDRYSRRALEFDPNDLRAGIVRAQLAAQKSDWNSAITSLNAVAQRSPSVLIHAVNEWPAQLAPPQTQVISPSVTKFFSCVRAAANSCAIPEGRAAPNGSSNLYGEQRWELVVEKPLPPGNQRAAWLERGVALASLGDCRGAISALEHGLSNSAPRTSAPGASTSETYGMFLLSSCYSQEAGRIADQVQQSGGDEAPLHIMRGDILLRLQAKADLAESEYHAALTRDPGDPALLERLADAQFGSGKIDAARGNAEAALQIDPQRLPAKRTMAKIAMQERDYAMALPYLREIVMRNPQDTTTRVDLATACAQTGALDDAWRNLAPVLEQGYPDEKGSLHYLLGTVLKKLGRSDEADEAFADATRLSDSFQQESYRDQGAHAHP